MFILIFFLNCHEFFFCWSHQSKFVCVFFCVFRSLVLQEQNIFWQRGKSRRLIAQAIMSSCGHCVWWNCSFVTQSNFVLFFKVVQYFVFFPFVRRQIMWWQRGMKDVSIWVLLPSGIMLVIYNVNVNELDLKSSTWMRDELVEELVRGLGRIKTPG
jgi:hypothetical protein